MWRTPVYAFLPTWLEPDPLPVYFEGQNVLPTIHVLDLASVVQNIVDNPPRQRYIVVKDESANTLADIIRAISAELSTGEVLHLPTKELVQAEWIPQLTLDQLTMNLKIECATIKEEMQIRWVSERGMVESMQRLVKEFIESNGLKPLRLCVLGPPVVGKTALSKELCKIYRLHHIHLKAVIYETYKNLMEPIKALEHFQEMRRAEQVAAEAARQRELELAAEQAEATEGKENELEEKPLASEAAREPENVERIPNELAEKPTFTGTYGTTDYEEYKFTSTADEVPSIRRSTFTESISDLELYPMDPSPSWKTEEELEALAVEAQEQLEILRENTDENGRLIDEMLVRLVANKLMSHACQNQGFVLDGFPKTLNQAELLFQSDEQFSPDNKPYTYNQLLMPHHVFMLEGSDEYVFHRMRQLATASGLDPNQARVIPPPWPSGFRLERAATLMPTESYLVHSDSALTDELVPESRADGEEDKVMEKIEELETYHDRFVRRLELYRAMMAPAAAAERNRRIKEAEQLAMEEAEAEEEKARLASLAAEDEQELGEQVDEQGSQNEEKPVTVVEDTVPERLMEVIEQAYEKSLAARMELIPPLPETPSDTEENVLSYFDLREVHPLYLNMDADLSKVSDTGGCREQTMEQIRHRIGQQNAVPLPFCSAMPPKLTDIETAKQMIQRAEKAKLKRELSAKNRERREDEERKRLLEKLQKDWSEWIQLVRAQNYQCAEAKALPMRHYLMRYVMPELTEALLACSEIRPEDPIDYVAEYLLKGRG